MNDRASPSRLHVVVVADGDPPDRRGLDAVWPGWDAEIDLVIAADGGARGSAAAGLPPDVVVGDGDSLGEEALAELAATGAEVLRARTDKDETDTELALLEAVRRGATRITLLGAVGGPRVDHELANVLLLAREELAGVPVAILDPRARISLVDARGRTIERQLPGALGAPISLLSIGSPGPRVRTSGLRYPLHDEPLALGPARGVSNVRTEPDASIRVRDGRLLIVETPVSLGS